VTKHLYVHLYHKIRSHILQNLILIEQNITSNTFSKRTSSLYRWQELQATFTVDLSLMNSEWSWDSLSHILSPLPDDQCKYCSQTRRFKVVLCWIVGTEPRFY